MLASSDAPLYLISLTVLVDLVLVPAGGAMVRYRAHYNPNGAIRLDGDLNSTVPVMNGYLSMFRRIYRIEGWAGFYKGLMPTLAVHIISTIFYLLNLNPPAIAGPRSDLLLQIIYRLFLLCLTMLIAVPLQTITTRAICTPYILPMWSPVRSLRLLLTPTERRFPWKLYMTPGLIVLHVLIMLWSAGFLILTSYCLGLMIPSIGNNTFVSQVLAKGLFILSTLWVYPPEVMLVRLRLQRNHDTMVEGESPGMLSTEADQAAKLGLKEYSETLDVMGFRDEFDPYTSLPNCFGRMKREEGLKVFYRGYWIIVVIITLKMAVDFEPSLLSSQFPVI